MREIRYIPAVIKRTLSTVIRTFFSLVYYLAFLIRVRNDKDRNIVCAKLMTESSAKVLRIRLSNDLGRVKSCVLLQKLRSMISNNKLTKKSVMMILNYGKGEFSLGILGIQKTKKRKYCDKLYPYRRICFLLIHT